jgi:hypothetical protein
MEHHGSDRRRRVRIGAAGQGQLTILDPSFPAQPLDTGDFLLVDLSVNGARIQTVSLATEQINALHEGRNVLALNLDAIIGTPVRALCIVRWVKPLDDELYELGLEFSEMPEEHRRNLQHHLFGLLGAAGIAMETPQRALRRVLRAASPYIVAAAAVALGLLVGHFSGRARVTPSETTPSDATTVAYHSDQIPGR